MKTLDFVSSLTLDSDLVRAVLFCICIILESSFLSIPPASVVGTRGRGTGPGGQSRSPRDTQVPSPGSPRQSVLTRRRPECRRSTAEKLRGHGGESSTKFVCLEEKAFFVKYLNLYKKMTENDPGSVQKTCSVAWGRRRPRPDTRQPWHTPSVCCSLWNEPPEKPGAGRGRAGSWEMCRKSLLNTHLCPPGLATDTFILLQEPSKQVM